MDNGRIMKELNRKKPIIKNVKSDDFDELESLIESKRTQNMAFEKIIKNLNQIIIKEGKN